MPLPHRMKVPDPLCGLYPLKEGARIIAVTHVVIGSFLFITNWVKLAAQATVVNHLGELNMISVSIEVFISLGLLFNLVLQIVLRAGVIQGNLNVCRAWLGLGIVAGVIIHYIVYDGLTVDQVRPLSDFSIVFSISSIIFHVYAWYVILAYVALLQKRQVVNNNAVALVIGQRTNDGPYSAAYYNFEQPPPYYSVTDAGADL